MRTTMPSLSKSRPVFAYVLVALLFMAALGAARAQEGRPHAVAIDASEAEARLVTIEQGDIKLIERVLDVFRGSSLSYVTLEDMNVIALYGPAHAVQAAEDIIKQLDRPVHEESVANVVFTVDILTNVKELGEPVSENANPGVEAVRKDFPVEELFLMDRVLMRARDGSHVEGTGFIPLGGEQPSTYHFKVDRAAIETTAEKRLVRLDDMVMGAELFLPEPEKESEQAAPSPQPRPGVRRSGQNRYSVGLRTGGLILKPGQPFVTSKQNLTPGEALYFVVTARIEE